MAFLVSKLVLKYPGSTFVASLENILGSFLGRIVVLAYAIFFFLVTVTVTREFGAFITTVFIPETPMGATLFFLIFCVGYLLKQDLNVIGMVTDNIGFFFLVSFIALFLLLLGKFQYTNILPVLDKSVGSITLAAIVPIAWVGEIILLSIYLPYCDDLENATKKLYLGVLGITFFKIINVLASIFTFGADTNIRFPVFALGTLINIVAFFRNLSAIILIIWIAGVFFKTAAFQGGILIVLQDTLGIKNYRILIWPMAMVIYSCNFIFYVNVNELSDFIMKIFPYFALVFEMILPAIILCIAGIRGDHHGISADYISNNNNHLS